MTVWTGGGLETCGRGGNPLPAGPIVLVFTAGGSRAAWPERLDRSNGAPASRPPGAPIPVSEPTALGGAEVPESVPKVRGAPGAFGFWAGSKTSCRPDDAAGRP